MTKHAWDAYEPFLGIADKAVLVSPPTKDNLTTMNDFGKESISLTAIAAMDTLLLMGLYNEYVIARNHILSNLKYEQVRIGNFEGGLMLNTRMMPQYLHSELSVKS